MPPDKWIWNGRYERICDVDHVYMKNIHPWWQFVSQIWSSRVFINRCKTTWMFMLDSDHNSLVMKSVPSSLLEDGGPVGDWGMFQVSKHIDPPPSSFRRWRTFGLLAGVVTCAAVCVAIQLL